MLAIVDTGCANLASVAFAFERLGVRPQITQNARDIQSADHVILPGVGSMSYAMKSLQERGLIELLGTLTQPVLGICLGMQMLFAHSEEGDTAGLGLLPDTVQDMDTGDFPKPHMGWNSLNILKEDPLLSGIGLGDYVYFVHSYAVPLRDITLASAQYGQEFSAVIRRGNIFGCQFHPERSGEVGARILQNFLKVKL